MSFSTEMFLFPNIWNLQELAAKLEAMNETAMEKLSTLMETSEADGFSSEVLAKV